MKFVRKVTSNGVSIPHTALRTSGLVEIGVVELHMLQNAIVVMQEQMTAAELLDAAQCLRNLSFSLLDHLVDVCGSCEDCEQACMEDDKDDAELILPKAIREAADIPEDARVRVRVDADGKLILTVTEYPNILDSVPPALLDELCDENICVGALAEHLEQEDIVYGK